MRSIRLFQGDSLSVLKRLPSNSVHCIVSSPPYWGLRDYEVEGQVGLEESWEEHLDVIVKIFREARRVLHPSGSLWLNYGDCYATGAGGARNPGGDAKRSSIDESHQSYPTSGPNRNKQNGLKPKDLVGMPWRVAFALQDDGWYLRSDVIWHKTNGMPGSAGDRPTTTHEYIFLMTKSEKYFYDVDAVRVITGREATWEEYVANSGKSFHDHGNDEVGGMRQAKRKGFKSMTHPLGARRRTVWAIATEKTKYKHTATFPKKLVQPCVMASTSEQGCCSLCLAPRVRVYEDLGFAEHGERTKRPDTPGAVLSEKSSIRTGKTRVKKPIGWEPGCKCTLGHTMPCTVLDPFSGTATTGYVASQLGRSYVGIDLDPRCIVDSQDNLKSFGEIEVVA